MKNHMQKKGWYEKLARGVALLMVVVFMFTGVNINVFATTEQTGDEDTSIHVAQKNAVAAAGTSDDIALRRIDGSGKAFVYHSFQETKTFQLGGTYAFLSGVYEYDDAVSSLGAGAILKATDKANDSSVFIQRNYGTSANVKVYVDVVTKGSDFDNCIIGGLYEVPNSGTPTEYRYFCGFGGAKNCGPYYAYDYQKECLYFENVSASLKTIEKQGSENPEDYTVTITYNNDQRKTLDSGSYTVTVPDPASDKVTFVISDNEGNSITANFQCPLAVRYEGNAENVTDVPSTQSIWKGESGTISSQKPIRAGYEVVNWKDAESGTTYAASESFTATKSLRMLAQWKDIKAPEVNYTPIQVMTGTSDEDVKSAVKAALTITDNEPVEECTVEVQVSTNFTSTVGNKDVTVTVTDKAGNSTNQTYSVNVASYVDISTPVFTESGKNLSAVLNNPGTDTITESGFVWGVMNAPDLTVNNGKEKTAAPVSRIHDTISVTADNLQKGVTYYARAYMIAQGVTYYSEEISFGIGLPAYGTFTIQNNGNNTFTVTRSGGTEGEQAVYYRTVNGSAVGGTHFTHQAAVLTFKDGEKTKTITVAENTANKEYSSKPATAYTNADRIYSVELYRVTGGGMLGSLSSAQRKMTKKSDYTVDRSIYDWQTINGPQDEKKRGDYDTDKLGWTANKSYDAAKETISIQESFLAGTRTYWTNTGESLYYQLTFDAKEQDAGYQAVQITPGSSLDLQAHPYDNTLKGSLSTSYYMVLFEHAGSGKNTNWDSYTFPRSSGNKQVLSDTSHIKGEYVYFDLMQSEMSVGYGACGTGSDAWYTKKVVHHFQLQDTTEPQLLGVAPMAGGLYKVGDSFTVALIFDEIVDSQNSTLSKVSLNTSWGIAKYAGGADTNVLYFTGTVASNASGNLRVNSIANTNQIKDMCNSTTTKTTSSGTGATEATVDASVPDFTVTANGIANGTGTAAINVNNDNKTTGMRYAWSDSSTAPTSGWVELTAAELSTAKDSGLSLSIRKGPGSGSSNGKWYLHVIGTYDTTGATAYKNACVNFGTTSSPASGSTSPSLAVTVDNTNWATSRTITIQAAGAETLKYRKSGVSDWKMLSNSTTGVAVTENGYYTFLLTAGETTITKTVQVEKIDLMNPTAAVRRPTSDSVESPKAGIYTELSLPITYSDAQSGVRTVQYAWTNSQTTPSSWSSLSSGAAAVTYTATESVPTEKYLHLQVTDNVGHIYTTCSAAYTVISRSAVEHHTPTITITGAPASWTNDMVTLTWNLENYSGKNYEIILPDGRKAKAGASGGEVWAMKNGIYTVKVRDLDYGGENTASVTVDKLDFTAPSVTVSGIAGDWTKGSQTVTLSASDTGSGMGEIWYKMVKTKEEIPKDGLTQLGTGETITVDQDGEWYLYYKAYDKTGDNTIGREANKTEGFTKLIKIDKTAPVIGEISYNYEPKNLWDWLIGKESLMITVPVTEEGSGADEITYTVTPEGGLSQNKTAPIQNGSAQITVSADFKGTISIVCTDKAGNTASGVTVGTLGKGLIIEDNAPKITFGKYTAVSGMTVTVEDDKDNVISAGLASVTYKIGDGQEVSVQENFTENLKTKIRFNIEPAGVPSGGTDIIVRAVDNAGNQATETVTIAKHTVTYDYSTNGGSTATKTSEVILSGDEIDLRSTATKSGWEFVGWNTDKDAQTGLTSLKMGNGDVTLYAIYSKTLTLTCYSGSAGDKQTNTVTIYNNATAGSLTVPTATAWGVSGESYDFSHYVTEPNKFTGTVYGGNEKIPLSEDTVLYAIYKKAIKISYDANGGSGTNEQIVYKRAHVADTVTYQTDSFLLSDGSGFHRTGYRFNGWTEGSGTGTVIGAGTSVTPTGDRTYYANWTKADYHVTLHPNGGNGGTNLTSYTYGAGAKLPTDWTRKGYTFGGWYVNEKCNGTAVTDISATETGEREYWLKWVDDIAPVIGTLTYSYAPKNLWNWLIGKESLMITVPVTEEGSGAEEITYIVTSEGGSAQNKTAPIQNGSAQITVSADFKGTISLSCTDKAGNTSASVTVGTGLNEAGIIIEDNAPQITFEAENAESLQSGEFTVTPDIVVTVTDNKDNAVSGGIASVSYRIGNGSEKTVANDYTTNMVVNDRFTISAGEISSDETVILVTATDHAGNRITQTYQVKVHTHSGTFIPAAEPTYTAEGNKAYYICTCGKWFSDSSCTNEITDHESVIVEKLGHDFNEPYFYDKDGVQTVPAMTDHSKIIRLGEPVATGNVKGMAGTSTAFNLGDGAVIVTVVCEEQGYTAGVTDTVALANAVLTPEQIQLVMSGETIEIRMDVTDRSGKISTQDEKVIQDGIKASRKRLTLGRYIDISMFIKIGAGDWNAVTATKEPIEVVIGIPQELQSDDREFYIIRSHEGEYTLLTDTDDQPDTITICTDSFSAYAIAYEQADKAEENHKCGLCYICPTFLGICYFIWLAVIIVICLLLWIVIRSNRKQK